MNSRDETHRLKSSGIPRIPKRSPFIVGLGLFASGVLVIGVADYNTPYTTTPENELALVERGSDSVMVYGCMLLAMGTSWLVRFARHQDPNRTHGNDGAFHFVSDMLMLIGMALGGVLGQKHFGLLGAMLRVALGCILSLAVFYAVTARLAAKLF